MMLLYLTVIASNGAFWLQTALAHTTSMITEQSRLPGSCRPMFDNFRAQSIVNVNVWCFTYTLPTICDQFLF